MSTEVGFDGCPSCFGCSLCNYDCCSDCTHDSQYISTKVHDCPTCRCDGGTVGIKHSNQVCNCEGHICTEEVSDGVQD